MATSTAAAPFVIVALLRAPHDLREALAKALHLPEARQKDFFVNIPPGAARYPGAIFVAPEMLVLEDAAATDDELIEGPRFTLTASDDDVAAGVSSFRAPALQAAAREKDHVTVHLHVPDGRVLELPVAKLKQRLLSSEAAISASNKGRDPLVVTRAYVGTLTFTLKQKSSAGGSLVADAARAPELAANAAIKVDASADGKHELRIVVESPTVFAFEASSARFITHSLGIEPDDVELTPVAPASPGVGTPPPSPPPSIPWTLATMASGYYPRLRTLDQDWNGASTDLLAATLREYGPAKILQQRATPEAPLTTPSVKKFLAEVTASADATNSQLIVLYHVGHTLAFPDRTIAAVLGDAQPLRKDVVAPPPGYLDLREIYEALSSSSRPFAFLVDGCLRNEEFEEMREGLGIVTDRQTRSFFYLGPGERPHASLSEFGTYLRGFPVAFSYLRADNPVVLAAKPGTYAHPWTNPDLSWGVVGPLAARIANYSRKASFDPERPTLADLISNVTDFNGTGEISPKGSVSWSDFATFRDRASQIVAPPR